MSSAERHGLVDNYLTNLRLLAHRLVPEATIEATTEAFEDEDCHVRVYPPAGVREEKLADRCVDIQIEKGVFDLWRGLRLIGQDKIPVLFFSPPGTTGWQ